MPKTREQKRNEAEARKAHVKDLSLETRLARLETRPGKAKREHDKLLGKIEKRGHVTKADND